MPVVVLRAADVYDELCHAAFIDHQIARIYGRSLTSHVYPGDLTAGQPYLHVADLIDALQDAVEKRRELPPESTFLLGDADVMGFDEIQQAVSARACMANRGRRCASPRRWPAPVRGCRTRYSTRIPSIRPVTGSTTLVQMYYADTSLWRVAEAIGNRLF